MNYGLAIGKHNRNRTARAEHLRQASILGIDTEYDSFRYFREKLCLIQIYAPKTTYVIDATADLDLSFLARPFKSKSVVKILHAADNDIRLLKRDYGFEFQNIFDTHRAAMLLGFRQLSLDKMIKEFLDVDLKKSKKMQRSRWDHRPLTDEQLEYAVQDVTLLPALYEKQKPACVNKGWRPRPKRLLQKSPPRAGRKERLTDAVTRRSKDIMRWHANKKSCLKNSMSGVLSTPKKPTARCSCFCRMKSWPNWCKTRTISRTFYRLKNTDATEVRLKKFFNWKQGTLH